MIAAVLDFFRDHWWVWIFLGMATVWVSSLLLVRYLTLRSLRAALDQEEARFEDLEVRLTDPQPQDQQALRLLKEYRRRYLFKLWPDTKLSFREINDLSQTLVAEIARIYFPEEERPELKASLADLMSLYRRVGVRLAAWLETVPFRPLKDMELSTVMLLHDTYKMVRDHPVHQFLKRHHMYRMARWVWGAVNIFNPYYWGRQAAYTGGREFLARTFLAKVVTVVGEESIRLYSRRSPNLRIFRRYQVGLQEMINLALGDNGALPAEVTTNLLKPILKARGLEDQEKVALLKKVSRPRRRQSALADLEPPEQKEVQDWLEGLVKVCWEGPEQQERLAQVRERWQEAIEKSEPES
jgi:hypothetical protein